MKKRFLTLILIVITIVQVLAPFSVGYDKKKTIEITPNKVEAADCSFVSATFSPSAQIETDPKDIRPETTTLTIKTSGCVGNLFDGYIRKDDLFGNTTGVPVLKFDKQEIVEDDLTFTITTGENYCGTSTCETVLDLYLLNLNGGNLDHYTSEETATSKDYLDFKCATGTCNAALTWSTTSSQGTNQSTNWSINPSVTSNSITVSGIGPIQTTSSTSSTNFTNQDTLTVGLYQSDGTLVKEEVYNIVNDLKKNNEITYTTTFTGLEPATGYNVKLKTRFGEQAMNSIFTLDASGQTVVPLPQDNSNRGEAQNGVDILPACGLLNGALGTSGTFMGCVAQAFYYVLFVPTSYIFALAGTFFDFTFHYSIQDESYKTPFVVEGWGIVRDMCNMFFIFVLLYIAFGTILNLHSVKTKEMIINVVIIGLLINFSLFATQVIIDASNILARVFYNSDSIKITQTDNAANGVANTTPGLKIGPNGEIPLSAAIVNKVNPQNLIINGTKAVVIKDNVQKQQTSAADDKEGNLGVGAFILITLLATAVNIVGLIAFLSVGLIFVARVIGLWFAMILSPFVFFSYTVPALQDMEMVGWKKWWPETLKLAFLAPVFIFFMYLIIAFLEKGLSLVSANDTSDGMSFVISVIVPFIFIMILLMKAKDIAKDMSGKLGQSITNGIAAVGGIALGGAALGAAALGRGTIGAVSKFTQNDGARQNALKFKGVTDQWSQMNKLNPFSYFKLAGRGVSGLGKAATALPAAGFSMIGRKTDPHTGKTTNAFQRETAKLADKEHASHILDEKAQGVTGNKEAKYKDLTEDEQKKVHNVIDRDIASKEQYNKVYDKLDSTQRAALDGYRNPADPRGDWAGAAEMNKTIAAGRGEHIHTAEELSKNSKEPIAVSEFVNALRKGSYDIRNISKLQTSSKGMAKAGIGIAAVVASGVRMGLKNGVGIEHGAGQKDLFKDLGNVISESLKGIKLDIPKAPPSGGGHSGGDSHGGGHH